MFQSILKTNLDYRFNSIHIFAIRKYFYSFSEFNLFFSRFFVQNISN